MVTHHQLGEQARMDDNALKSLTARAQSGDADAQYQLAVLILDGEMFEPDDSSWEVDRAHGKELEEGSRWLIMAARNGNREAQTDLAKRYHYGIDFPENQTRAFEWFTLAADNECGEAQFFLGELFTGDDVVPYDIETALQWYERSAANGYQWAQLALFDIFRHGADLRLPNIETAVYWGRKAGEQGNLSAQVGLGKLFFEGELVERNPMEAAFWLHLAADLDDEAKYLLAILYFHGQGVDKKVAKSAELFRSLARKGDADAMVQLALVLSEMFRPPHDEIHSWLIKASALGHVHAREMLEEIESSNRPVEGSNEFKTAEGQQRTPSQLHALAEAGDAEAQFGLARLLEEGRELQGDYKEAVRWYQLAAAQGHAAAQWSLSTCYQAGLGVEPDEQKAIEFLQRSAGGGNPDAQLQLGWQYYFGSIVAEDKRKAFQLFKNASEQWNLNALVWQGHCYEHGAGVVSDRRKACELYRKAAELGIINAQFKLGMMYWRGLGVRQNCEEAADWFSRAARHNHSAALVELGRMHLTGDGVARSKFQAEIFFRRAAELGDADGKFELGRLLLLADDRDIDIAIKQVTEAAEENVVEAQLYLANLYEQGHGSLQPDIGLAAKWYQTAANNGDKDAKYRLTALLSRDGSRLCDLLNSMLDEDVSTNDRPSSKCLSEGNWQGEMIANKFVVLSLLADDQFGRTYKARNVFTDRIVAIKVLRTWRKSDDMLIRRFQREAKAISRIAHANLIRLHDFGIGAGAAPYIVQEYLRGSSLEALLKQEGSIDLERCLSIFLQILDGLTVAHEAGIIHGDIRPGAITILNARSGQETAKLVDFGVARLFLDPCQEIDRIILSGFATGTPTYLSPEQFQGQALDSRSDIYSLGCVLFEALTGQRAISAGSFFETLCAQLYQPPASIIQTRPEAKFSHQLDAVVSKMMAKDPNARYQDLLHLRENLIQVLAAAA